MFFDIVVACSKNLGIGNEGELPWGRLPPDLRRFSELTKGNVVIMGRGTWESLPESFRPLPDRVNYVLTSGEGIYPEGVNVFKKLMDAVKDSWEMYPDKIVYVIGGQEVYREALWMSCCRYIYLTYIYNMYSYDKYLAGFDNTFKMVESGEMQTYKDIRFKYFKYEKTMYNWEWQYHYLIRNILDEGNISSGRNGKTLSIFGRSLEFDVSETFPMMTTRKVFLRGVFEELMWMLRGDTNTKTLDAKGIKVWNPNSTREFLDSVGLEHLPEGDIGATYGHNFRYFGAKYVDCNKDYTGQGFDQLYDVIDKIKNYQSDRRMIISLWDPCNLKNCALPPCVRDYQFYVDSNTNTLSLQVSIRSSDVPVALHWNIVSAGLFLYLMANFCELKPSRLRINIGNAHIYMCHKDIISDILTLETKPFPKLNVIRKADKIEDYEYCDIELNGYFPNIMAGSFKLDMVP